MFIFKKERIRFIPLTDNSDNNYVDDFYHWYITTKYMINYSVPTNGETQKLSRVPQRGNI